jgi:hypothetical protein
MVAKRSQQLSRHFLTFHGTLDIGHKAIDSSAEKSKGKKLIRMNIMSAHVQEAE